MSLLDLLLNAPWWVWLVSFIGAFAVKFFDDD